MLFLLLLTCILFVESYLVKDKTLYILLFIFLSLGDIYWHIGKKYKD